MLTHRTYQCRPLGDGRCGNTIAGWNRAIKDDIGDHAHGTIDMERAIAVSCNAYFAQLGVHDVGSKALAETADRLGLSTGDAAALRQALPFAAYGQGPVLVTPFKMARVAATIAAGGQMPQGRWIAGDGNSRQDAPLEVLAPAQAAFLAGAMRRVVTEGTARHVMAGTAVEMAGKTGTAQLDRGLPHAWFTGFAPLQGAAGTAAGLRGDRGTRRLWRTRRGADRARIDGGGQRVGIAMMNLTEFLEKFGRTLFESPLARTASVESPPELAEIRFAVLDEVRRNSYRAGRAAGVSVRPRPRVHARRGREPGRRVSQRLLPPVPGARNSRQPARRSRALPRAVARGGRRRDRLAAGGRALADGRRGVAGTVRQA